LIFHVIQLDNVPMLEYCCSVL